MIKSIKGFIVLVWLISAFVSGETIQTKSTELLASPKEAIVENTNSTDNIIDVIFYRLDGDINIIPTIKIEDHVVGSLIPNHYAATKACKNRLNIGVAERGDIINYTHYNYSDLDNLSNNLYIRVNEPKNGKFTLSIVDSKQAKNEISHISAKSTIMNRYYPDCKNPKRFQISANALFDFDSSYLKEEGKAILDKFVNDIKKSNIKITGLNITGYTDKLGDEKYNKWLSQKRADRVAKYLQSKGFSDPINVKGAGEANPISKGCDKLNGNELKKCLSVDRRIEIEYK